MNVGDKEFYELMDRFEKSMKLLIYGHRVDRVNRDKLGKPKGNFYNDGYVNTMFHVFMHGYSFGKCVERQE